MDKYTYNRKEGVIVTPYGKRLSSLSSIAKELNDLEEQGYEARKDLNFWKGLAMKYAPDNELFEDK